MYVELVIGTKWNRGKFVEVDSLTSIDYYGQSVKDGFYSLFAFDEGIKEYFTEKGSVKGYRGPVCAPYLVWDIDSNTDNPKQSLIETTESLRELYTRLINEYSVPQSAIKVFMSGNKGYHVFVYSQDMSDIGFDVRTPFVMKQVCECLATDIRHIDSAIYNHNRIFRIPNTQHGSSGLYKVDLTELINKNTMSPDTIVEYAAEQKVTSFKDSTMFSSQLIKDMIVDACKEYSERGVGSYNTENKIGHEDVFDVYENGWQKGSRNDTACRIAGMLHHRGHDENYIRVQLRLINKISEEPLPDHEIDSVVASITSYPVNPLTREISVDNIHTFGEAGRSWLQRQRSSGFLDFGPRMSHLTTIMSMAMPGDVTTIVANSGVGKTLVGMQIINEISKAMGTYALKASLEMNKEGLFFRTAIIEIATGEEYVPPRKVAERLLNDDSLIDIISNEWNRLYIVDDATSAQEIEKYFSALAIELKKEGKILSDLLIDYGQLLDGTEETKSEKVIARGMKPMAKNNHCRVWILLQLNKSFIDPYVEPERKHIEGTGAWYQVSDFSIFMWLSKAEEKRRIHCKMGKQRGDVPGRKFDFIKNGLMLTTEDFLDEDTADVQMREGAFG